MSWLTELVMDRINDHECDKSRFKIVLQIDFQNLASSIVWDETWPRTHKYGEVILFGYKLIMMSQYMMNLPPSHPKKIM